MTGPLPTYQPQLAGVSGAGDVTRHVVQDPESRDLGGHDELPLSAARTPPIQRPRSKWRLREGPRVGKRGSNGSEEGVLWGARGKRWPVRAIKEVVKQREGWP